MRRRQGRSSSTNYTGGPGPAPPTRQQLTALSLLRSIAAVRGGRLNTDLSWLAHDKDAMDVWLWRSTALEGTNTGRVMQAMLENHEPAALIREFASHVDKYLPTAHGDVVLPWERSTLEQVGEIFLGAALLGAGGITARAAGAGEAAEAAEGGSVKLPASETWGRPETLAKHYKDHGADFGAASGEEYARLASEFFQRGLLDKLPTKIDPKTGAIRIYDPATNSFGAYNATGTTATFFKPDPSVHGYATNWDYWLSQPGSSPW